VKFLQSAAASAGYLVIQLIGGASGGAGGAMSISGCNHHAQVL